MSWTSLVEIRAKVRRRWDDGSLLRSYAAGEPFPRVEVPLRGPRPAEIGDRLGEVQTWVAALRAGSGDGAHYSLEQTMVGGRLIGRNTIPGRAVLERYRQAWALLGVSAEVRKYDEILTMTAAEPAVRAWVGDHPLDAIRLWQEWRRLTAAYRWLDDHRGSGRYLREIEAPGVDTKFVERHRAVLAGLLGVPTSSTSFLTRLGLARKPELLRLRPDPSLGAFSGLTDVTARAEELRTVNLPVRVAVIVENEITFLSVPVPSHGLVLWGKGFEVDRAGSLPWLRDTAVHYWGDLDTHGFAILDQLRAWLPHADSFLMDRETLLTHQDRWGREISPSSARLDRLTPEESALYAELVGDRLGDCVRLEQERVDWTWAQPRFPFM